MVQSGCFAAGRRDWLGGSSVRSYRATALVIILELCLQTVALAYVWCLSDRSEMVQWHRGRNAVCSHISPRNTSLLITYGFEKDCNK